MLYAQHQCHCSSLKGRELGSGENQGRIVTIYIYLLGSWPEHFKKGDSDIHPAGLPENK